MRKVRCWKVKWLIWSHPASKSETGILYLKYNAALPTDPEGWMSNIWGVVKEIGSSGLCPIASAYTWSHSPSLDNQPSLVSQGQRSFWDVGPLVLKLGRSWSPSIQWNLPNASQGESSRSYLLQVLHSVWASLGRSPSLCRAVSRLSHLSSPLSLSGTLELGTRSKVTFPGLFHYNLFTRLPSASCCSPLGNPDVHPQWCQAPSSPGNQPRLPGHTGACLSNSLWSTQLMRSK